MEEIIKNSSRNITAGTSTSNVGRSFAIGTGIASKEPPENLLDEVVDKVTIKAYIQELGKDTTVTIDLEKYPNQKDIIGKKVGDTFKLAGVKLTYEIVKILSNEPVKKTPTVKPVSSQEAPPATLTEYFTRAGFKVVDLRPNGGCFWVVGERNVLEPYVEAVSKVLGATGGYGAGKATGFKNGWWTKSKM
jgi:hypothetical protein